MKKILLALLLFVGGVSATHAQNHSVQTAVMSYLQETGYSASYDDAKDIIFKIDNYSYYIIFQRDLVLYPEYGVYTHIQVCITFTSHRALNELVRYANELNKLHYNKYLAYTNNGLNYFQVIVESIVTSEEQACQQVRYATQILPEIISELEGHI